MLTPFKILQILEVVPDVEWDGPRWLAYFDYWPEQKEITPTKEAKKEAKMNLYSNKEIRRNLSAIKKN